jgi:hypothetical protein
MDHFVFVLWMLGHPLVCSYINFKAYQSRHLFGKGDFADNVKGIAALINITTYACVGMLLW